MAALKKKREAAGGTAGVVDLFTELRVNGLNHGADDLAWGEELAAVGILLAHFQEQILIDLGEGEEVGGEGGAGGGGAVRGEG